MRALSQFVCHALQPCDISQIRGNDGAISRGGLAARAASRQLVTEIGSARSRAVSVGNYASPL